MQLVVLLLALATAATASGETVDGKLVPIAIEADSAEQDEQLGLTIYRGNVTMTQGELRIEAAKVEIHSREDEQQNSRKVSRIAASGDPAVFSHRSSDAEAEVVAQAQEINYQPENGIVEMLGNASLVQQGSSVRGNKIEYFVNDKKVKAAADPQDRKTRVKTVITPGQSITLDAPEDTVPENMAPENTNPGNTTIDNPAPASPAQP